MSPVDFKKWQCPLLLFLTCSRRFRNSPMSPVEFKVGPMLCRYLFSCRYASCRLLILRKGCIALSNCKVKGPYRGGARLAPTPQEGTRPAATLLYSNQCRPGAQHVRYKLWGPTASETQAPGPQGHGSQYTCIAFKSFISCPL